MAVTSEHQAKARKMIELRGKWFHMIARAAESKQFHRMVELLEYSLTYSYLEPNYLDDFGRTLLHRLAWAGITDGIRILACLDKINPNLKLNVNPLDGSGYSTPLALVTSSIFFSDDCHKKKQFEAIKLLLELGADPKPEGIKSSDCENIISCLEKEEPFIGKKLRQIFYKAKQEFKKNTLSKLDKARGIFSAIDFKSDSYITVVSDNYPYSTHNILDRNVYKADFINMKGEFKASPGYARAKNLYYDKKLILGKDSNIEVDSFTLGKSLVLEEGSRLSVGILKVGSDSSELILKPGSIIQIDTFDESVPDKIRSRIGAHMVSSAVSCRESAFLLDDSANFSTSKSSLRQRIS